MMLTLLAYPLLAQMPMGIDDGPVAKPIVIMAVLVVLSLAPFLLIMTSSFIKIAVVLSMIRSALGTQQIPPNQVVTGMALILTIYIMMPVGQDVYTKVEKVIREPGSSNQPLLSQTSLDGVKRAVDAGKEPMRAFLMKHAATKDRSLFFNLAKQLRGDRTYEVAEDHFLIIIPAFIVSELADSFKIGFVLFLPFLVIDMVVSNILLAMGMFMVSPITVSLPFKLLLFVMVDGWYLISKGLILGYM